MLAFKPAWLFTGLILFSPFIYTQKIDSTYLQPKRPNIVLHTFDQKKYKCRLQRIGDNYLVVDASPYQSALQLNEYYMRRDEDFYKVDVEYINTVVLRKGRVVKNSALVGGATVGLLLAGLIYESSISAGDDELLATWNALVGGSAGFVVGGFTGAIVGLFSRKRIVVNGNPENLAGIHLYFNK